LKLFFLFYFLIYFAAQTRNRIMKNKIMQINTQDQNEYTRLQYKEVFFKPGTPFFFILKSVLSKKQLFFTSFAL